MKNSPEKLYTGALIWVEVPFQSLLDIREKPWLGGHSPLTVFPPGWCGEMFGFLISKMSTNTILLLVGYSRGNNGTF